MANPLDLSSRLYLEDPYRLEFDARIVERLTLEGDRVGLILDHTCFYPTSGGQPHDLGTLEGIPVIDVFEDNDGRITHVVREDPGADLVHGSVDRERRIDHMQQHSGQHLLSATCVELLGRETISFHLGAERCSIDLPGRLLEEDELGAVERRANEIIWEARPMRVKYLSSGDLVRLRKTPPSGVDTIRVVEIEDWDLNACCGTHVRMTSEIGVIKLLTQERVRQTARLHFVCGKRVLVEANEALRCLSDVVRIFTCHPAELAPKAQRLLEEAKDLRKEVGGLRRRLVDLEVEVEIDQAARVSGIAVVQHLFEREAADDLRHWAEALVESGAVALLGSRKERVQLLFVAPEALGLDLRPVMQQAAALVGGRGGGPSNRVQGTGDDPAQLSKALEAAREAVIQQLRKPASDFDKRSDAR